MIAIKEENTGTIRPLRAKTKLAIAKF